VALTLFRLQSAYLPICSNFRNKYHWCCNNTRSDRQW